MSIDHLPPVSRNSDPETSKIAEAMIRSRRLTQMLRLLRVYDRFQTSYGGMTDEQASKWAGVSHQSATKRCADLRNAGLIEPTGKTLYGSAGMPQRTCRITEEGLRVIALTRHKES